MNPLIADILNHPTDELALASLSDLRIKMCNQLFLKRFSLKNEDCNGKTIYDLLGIKVPREKSRLIIKQLEQHHFYIDGVSNEDVGIIFSNVKCDEESCCVVRLFSLNQGKLADQYARLFEKNLAGVYRTDIAGHILTCNRAMANILGYERAEDVLGRNSPDFYLDPKERAAFILELKNRGSLTNYELQIKDSRGSVRYCLTNTYLETADGQEEVIGTMLDITGMKEMERALLESETRFRTLSAVTHEGVVFSSNNIVIDCNEQFARMMGLGSCSDAIGRDLREFLNPSDLRRAKANAEISPSNRGEFKLIGRTSKPVFVEISGSRIQHMGDEVLALVMNDVTSRKRVELALQQSALGFRRLLENSPNGVVIITGGKIRYANTAACELFGVEDEDSLYEADFMNFISPEYRAEAEADLDEIRDGHEIDYKEIGILRASGAVIDVGIKSTLTAYENKPSIQVTLNNVTARNQLVQEQIRVRFVEEINSALKAEINEHKETQRKLEEQQRETVSQKARLESIFNSTENLMMWTINKDYTITGHNHNFATWMQEHFGEKVLIGGNIMALLQHHLDRDLYQGQLEAFNNGFLGRPQQFEFPLKSAHNQTMWLQAFLNPVFMNGKLEELSCLVYDNTERKEFDRKIRDSLKEKEVLLQEVHHRVKNNLQVISSILNLQSSYVDDPKTLEVLRESQQRIKSMSFIHETIYRTADFSKLEFTDYVRAIAGNLIQSYRSSEVEVKLVEEMDEVFLNLDQSIPCGLIVNELISNALKYAFQGRKKGKLTIGLHEKNNIITMLIKDDGKGLPKNFSYEKTNSLGIQLVYALLEQIDAQMQVQSKGGAEFLIAFPRK